MCCFFSKHVYFAFLANLLLYLEGHYMSASAQMWASTHNDTLKDKMSAVVSALFECQKKIGSGYLSAFPTEFFDRFEAIKTVWAPYYTIHKVKATFLLVFQWIFINLGRLRLT